MRKLTTMCCLAAAISVSFLGCRKNDNLVPNSFFSTTAPPSVFNHVLPLTEQSLDFQHIETHQNPNDAVQPSPTLNTNARFVLTYFPFFEGEKDTTYTERTFLSALLESGVHLKEAEQRTNRIFKTQDCSPLFLTETAQLLAPTLPRHITGAFICELFKPYDENRIETFLEKTSKNKGTTMFYTKKSMTECVKEVNKLVGVSGSIAAYGDSQVVLYLFDNEAHTPFERRFEAQQVRLILQKTQGYTEGEAIYLKLILGQLTEEEVWLLFEKNILPEWQLANQDHPTAYLVRLAFRYNYVEITGSRGRLGYTIYDLDGFMDKTTVF